MAKKVVSSSNLNLRFYRRHGWDLETLQKYVLQGELIDSSLPHHNDRLEESYFVPNVRCKLDINRLYENEVSGVERTFDDRLSEGDLSFMERMN